MSVMAFIRKNVWSWNPVTSSFFYRGIEFQFDYRETPFFSDSSFNLWAGTVEDLYLEVSSCLYNVHSVGMCFWTYRNKVCVTRLYSSGSVRRMGGLLRVRNAGKMRVQRTNHCKTEMYGCFSSLSPWLIRDLGRISLDQTGSHLWDENLQ